MFSNNFPTIFKKTLKYVKWYIFLFLIKRGVLEAYEGEKV